MVGSENKKSGTGKPVRLSEEKFFLEGTQPIAAIAFAVLLLTLAALLG